MPAADRSRVVTVYHALIEAARVHGDRPAVLDGDQRWSYRDLVDLTDGFAQDLEDRGAVESDRVAVMMENRVELIAAVHAIARIGAASVLVSPAWRAREVGQAIALTGPRHAVADGPHVAVLRGHLGPIAVVDVDDARPLPRPVADPAPSAGSDRGTADAVLVFSSGTTGLPKAVRHTQASIAAATEHWCTALGLGPDDRFQVATPPSHILGLLNLLAAVRAGATVRLHRRFDLDEVLRRIGEDRMTLEMAVAPIAVAIANHPRLESFDLSSLRYIMWGATPVSEQVARRVTARTGVRWLAAYGASEVPVIAANPVGDPDSWRLDSAGLPVPGVEVRIADLVTGAVLEAGDSGEIQVRSPSRMAGYLPDSATEAAFADGWYRTGDVGWMEPEGWVHLTDRSKELIKVNGFQVAPAELEDVLHGHPGVLDCAVFGVPDASAGEVPVAAVVIDGRHPVDERELRDLVAGTLASYKQLRHVVVVDAIPRLPSGKALRRTLRDEWAGRLVAADPDQVTDELPADVP